MGLHFPQSPFFPLCTGWRLFLILTSLAIINFPWALIFLTSSLSAQRIFLYFSHISILAFFLSVVSSCPWVWLRALFAHKGFLAFLPYFTFITMNCSWKWRGWSFTISQLSCTGLFQTDLWDAEGWEHVFLSMRPLAVTQFFHFQIFLKVINFSVFKMSLMIFCGKTDHLKPPRRPWIWFFSNLKIHREIFNVIIYPLYPYV